MDITKRAINRLRATLFPTIQDHELRRWYEDNEEFDKRLEYQLTSESVVIDLGGYDGQFASDIFSRYLAEIHVFEAIPEFAEKISRRFAANPKVRVYPCAIGNNARTDRMFLAGVGSSLFRRTDKWVSVWVEDAADLFKVCNITHCDLMKVNIEGGEYEVLHRLIETGLVRKIDNLQIQFHNLGPDSAAQTKYIRAELSKTHRLTWQYMWVWENWKCENGQRRQ